MRKISWSENIKKLLYNFLDENISGECKSILSGKPLVYYFWDDFAENFMQTRVDNNISLKSLRLTLENFDSEKHKDYSGYLKEIKHINIDEKFDWGIVFLDSSRVIIFDTQEMSAEVYNWWELFLKYSDLFDTYWNKKYEA